MSDALDFIKNEIEVLIVEDEMVLAFGMEVSLEDMGYSVSGIETTCENAINHVKENRPDIILMDINLKGRDTGIDAAKEIWQSYKTPIIFLTSYSDSTTVKNAMDCEPYGYLLKPCRNAELDIAIKTALNKHNYFFKNKETIANKTLLNITENYSYDKAKSILYKNEEEVKLTGNEKKFFNILSENLGESASFEKIITYIYREDSHDLGKLRTLVYRLRSKLDEELFENVYEFGYRLKVA